MTGRNERGEFTPGNGFASIGGRARAAQLPAERRSAIARAGWAAFVARRFGGDAQAAGAWLGAQGAWATERAAFGGSPVFQPTWEHPGPCPRAEVTGC